MLLSRREVNPLSPSPNYIKEWQVGWNFIFHALPYFSPLLIWTSVATSCYLAQLVWGFPSLQRSRFPCFAPSIRGVISKCWLWSTSPWVPLRWIRTHYLGCQLEFFAYILRCYTKLRGPALPSERRPFIFCIFQLDPPICWSQWRTPFSFPAGGTISGSISSAQALSFCPRTLYFCSIVLHWAVWYDHFPPAVCGRLSQRQPLPAVSPATPPKLDNFLRSCCFSPAPPTAGGP